VIKLNAKEIITELKVLSTKHGKDTEVEIAIQNVYADGEDIRESGIQVYYNDKRNKIVIYG
jgi:hypothetical protein